jgi:hypothetical protein
MIWPPNTMIRSKVQLESIGMDTTTHADDVTTVLGKTGGHLNASLIGGMDMPCYLGARGGILRDGPAALQGRDASSLHSSKKTGLDDHTMVTPRPKSMPSTLLPTTRGLHVNVVDVSSLPEPALDEEWNDDYQPTSPVTTNKGSSKAVTWHSTANPQEPAHVPSRRRSGWASHKPCSDIEEASMVDDDTHSSSMGDRRPPVFFHGADNHAVENCSSSIWESGVRLNSGTSAIGSHSSVHGGGCMVSHNNVAGGMRLGAEASAQSVARHPEAASPCIYMPPHPQEISMQQHRQSSSSSVPTTRFPPPQTQDISMQRQSTKYQGGTSASVTTKYQGGTSASVTTKGSRTVAAPVDDALRSHREKVAKLLRKGRSVMM